MSVVMHAPPGARALRRPTRTAWTCVILVLMAAGAVAHRFSAGDLLSVSPRGVSIGLPMHITGTGFDRSANKHLVTFLQGGVPVGTATGKSVADIDKSTATRRLTVEVPGTVPVGATDLRVVNQASGSPRSQTR
jgi:hypothetical protein